MHPSTHSTKAGVAIVIGAGPAGLTAAAEFQKQSGIRPVIVEAGDAVGGIARTVCYNGNRMDIGGHRFFSRSDRVMRWWLERMPLEAFDDAAGKLRYQGQERAVPASAGAHDPAREDLVMLVRRRRSRIYFERRFLDYPIRLDLDLARNLGALRAVQCGVSYLRSAVLPRRHEKSLEDFFINRFGARLYFLFFKTYTEKVWGVPCRTISAEWGAQRIGTLSFRAVIAHAVSTAFGRDRVADVAQKQTQTSLIERFLYPKFGAGQMWDHVAQQVLAAGGEIHLGVRIDRIHVSGNRVLSVEGVNSLGQRTSYSGDHFISTMPVCELIRALSCDVPQEVSQVSDGLMYRNFISVGLLARRLAVRDAGGAIPSDNWIYVHEPGVAVGRIQIFNNWSPWLVAKPGMVSLGLEYFCGETDSLWALTDTAMAKLAIDEAVKIGFLNAEDVEDWNVVRMPRAYPAYFGAYSRFIEIRRFTDRFENLFLVGRNGMHRYNNQDHSMLTAMTAVENIVNGVAAKDNIWAVNTGAE